MKPIFIALLAATMGCACGDLASADEPARFTEKIIWSFGSGTDGRAPAAGLTPVNGTLYSTTEGGGTSGHGTVFAFDSATGAEKIVYSFCSHQNCSDGDFPQAGLVDARGTLYGTTVLGGGGTPAAGTAFALDLNTGAEKVLHSFCSQQNCADGRNPQASLIDVNGRLYGTAYADTIFELNRRTGTEKVLYSFCRKANCADGAGLPAGVIDVGGMLYGTTSEGGNIDGCNEMGCGVVFSVDPNTGGETVLHTFGSGADGATPLAGLIDVNGTLFGTTSAGGNTNNGTVFSIDPNTGSEKVVYAFAGGADGAHPYAGLIAVNGTLYGTTYVGGGGSCTNAGPGCGTVYSVNPTTGAEQVLYAFQGGTDGAIPQAALLAVKGSLYGTTSEGGTYGNGTVFVLKKKR